MPGLRSIVNCSSTTALQIRLTASQFGDEDAAFAQFTQAVFAV